MTRPPKPPIMLLAEDDSDDRLLVKDAITECGWPGELRCVEDGEELLDYLRKRGKYTQAAQAPTPGLVLLDLNMPRMDGREALRAMRADASLRRTPVVVFTTSRADTDIARLYDLGANAFVTKPVQFDGLVRTMRRLCDFWFDTVELPTPR
jgi:CheY-like chemotaxis protein